MYLTAFFTRNGIPALGKSPSISGWTLDGSLAFSSSMTEVAGGFYAYNFSTYDHTDDYVFLAEDTSLGVGERYVIASNDVDSQNNQGVVKQILGLVQGNFVMSGQTYDEDGRLLTSELYTYDTATQADNDTDRLFEYDVEADYDGDGNLIYYKVTKR
jgi:hypothetical protein